MFAPAAAAQQFQILRAQYGYGDRWVDVTPRLRDLARTDQPFKVGNDAFGVDPAPGRGKTLRINARGPRGDTRTFEYSEGSVVDRSQFSDWNGARWGGPGREDFSQLTIISAVYGAANRNIDVAARLQSLVSDNRLNLTVSNATLDIDPAPGTHKTLSVTYSVGGGAQRGILTTASDLLFTGGREGYFHALDARTGALLWKASLGGSIVNGPITYEVDGKQYVAVIAGNALATFALRE